MGIYYNLRTNLKGGDICDKTGKFVIADGKLTIYKGKSRGFFRRRFEYTENDVLRITKSIRIEDNPLIFETGSGMITVEFQEGRSFQFHIFGNAEDFIKDIEAQIKNA